MRVRIKCLFPDVHSSSHLFPRGVIDEYNASNVESPGVISDCRGNCLATLFICSVEYSSDRMRAVTGVTCWIKVFIFAG